VADTVSAYPFVRRVGAGGGEIFAIQIPGQRSTDAILLGKDESVYLWGYANEGLATTPAAYRQVGSGPFVCKLSGSDGHILFCTYVDVRPNPQGFAADPEGNVYLATFNGSEKVHIEKLNSGGGLVYETYLEANSVTSAAADARGDLFVTADTYSPFDTYGSFSLTKLDPVGRVQGAVQGQTGEYAFVGLDPLGNPQLLIQRDGNVEYVKVRRYSADLSLILFETELSGFTALDMMLDSSGATVLIGGSDSINVPEVHPAGSCNISTGPETFPPPSPLSSHTVLARLDEFGHPVQSTFLALATTGITTGIIQQGGGRVLVVDPRTSEYAVVDLGPLPEVRLGCIGNAASLRIGPLAPEELISLFGQGLGPDQPVSAQPSLDNRYPSQLAGSQVTFDGVAVPLLYVGSNQINAVTPRTLAGRTMTRVCIVVGGLQADCMDVPVQPASPGIFLNRPSAAGFPARSDVLYAAALNQDGTINSQSNPAAPGSIVSIFATGLGSTNSTTPDGGVIALPPPSHDLKISISVVLGLNQHTNSFVFGSADVTYAGAAPAQIKGLSQINFKAPAKDQLVLIEAGEIGSFQAVTAVGAHIWMTP
jgi:uncharacterized protein (TIGR03437 family)